MTAAAISTLPRVDYEDACRVEVGPVGDRTAEQCARVVLEDAPASTRRALRAGWLSLGLQLGPATSKERVLGWEIRRSTPDAALLAARSRLGMAAEVLVKREDETLLAATFLQLETPVARAVWAVVAPGHREVVRRVFEDGGRRIREGSEIDDS